MVAGNAGIVIAKKSGGAARMRDDDESLPSSRRLPSDITARS
jgi:hypothetical protein